MIKEICLGGNISCNYDWCGKFQAPNPQWKHMSRRLGNYELMVVTQGTLYIADSRTQYEVKKGEYLLMAPTERQYGFRQSDCAFYWLHFALEEASCTGQECLHLNCHGRLPSMERVVILMKQLQDASRRYHNSSMNNSLLWTILWEISCQCGQDGNDDTSQLFEDIAGYIRYFVGQPLKVSEIADYFGYSSKYLAALFRRHRGMTVKQYILQQKMEHAMALLTDTNLTVGQIAYETGFEDANHFTNAFKKIAGISPKQYRDGFGKRALYFK